MLLEINKIAALVEFHKGTGNGGTIPCFAFNKPARGFRNTAGLGIEPHRATVPGATGQQQKSHNCQEQKPQGCERRVIFDDMKRQDG